MTRSFTGSPGTTARVRIDEQLLTGSDLEGTLLEFIDSFGRPLPSPARVSFCPNRVMRTLPENVGTPGLQETGKVRSYAMPRLVDTTIRVSHRSRSRA